MLLDKIMLNIPLSTQSCTYFLPKLLLCRAISLWYGSSIYKSLLLQNKVYFFDALNYSFRDCIIIFDFTLLLTLNIFHTLFQCLYISLWTCNYRLGLLLFPLYLHSSKPILKKLDFFEQVSTKNEAKFRS